MGKTLVFIGGAAGVGTTRAIQRIREQHPEYNLYDPRQRCYAYLANASEAEVQEEIVADFEHIPDGVTLIDWPFACRQEDGTYADFLTWDQLSRIGEMEDVEAIIVINLWVDPHVLLARRQSDCAAMLKGRPLDLRDCAYETYIAKNRYNELASALCINLRHRWYNMPIRIENMDLDLTTEKVVKAIETFQRTQRHCRRQRHHPLELQEMAA